MQLLKVVAGAALAAVAAAGCAPVPQVVTLDPQPEVVERFTDTPKQVALRVVDRRPRDILGYRDKESEVTLTAQENLDATVHDAVAAGLTRRGFEVVSWDPDADRRLEVEVTDFDYVAERVTTGVGRQVFISVDLTATAQRGERRHTAEFSTNTSERVIIGPTRAKNERMVNDVLSRAVTRVVNEDALVRLLDSAP